MVPSMTAVDGRSTMDECALPLKSTDTNSSSVVSRMPRSAPPAAARKASFTAAAVVDFSSSAVRSTTDTFEVGTRMARPSSLPLSSGSTRPTAVAAPVVVGIMLTAPARARRRSLCGKSWMGWSFVYECTVDAKPRLMPKLSRSTLATVARQLVVHEALDTSSCLTGSYFCSLTPSTTVMSGSLAGAVITTFLAPAWRCLVVVALSRKTPVDSTTIPTPISPHGRVAGSLAEQTRTSRPLTKIASPLAFTSASSVPWTESCFRRWARVLASARSLTATTSMSDDSRAARKNTRPIRPNPFTPTRTAMGAPLPVCLGLSNTSGPRRLPIIASPGREAQDQVPAARIGSGRAPGSALDDPGHREDADGAGRGVLEAAGALGQGGAGRQDVVHHDDVATRDQLGAPQPERAPHVRASGGAVERGLRWRRHRAYEDIVAHRAAPRPGESPGEQSRLIEAPLALPSRVQRDRHEQLGRPDGQVPLERLD